MSEVHFRSVDFQRMCRLCLQEKQVLIDIFDSPEDNYSVNILQKIKTCSVIDLYRGDGLPTKICAACLSSLNAAFDFKVQCEDSDKTLHSIIHLLINDEVQEEKSVSLLNRLKSPGMKTVELHTQKFFDLNHLIVVKNQTKEVTDEKEIHCGDSEKDAIDLIGTVNASQKNEEINNFVIGDNMINIELGNIPSNNALEVAVKKNDIEEISVVTLDFKQQISAGYFKDESNKTEVSDVKKSACPFCHKMLIRVNEHIRLLHQNKVYTCRKQNCGAEFLTLKNLQSHQLKCYNLEKPYKCVRCFKEFHRKCNFKAHIIRHSNKKNFQCQLCEKAFVDSTGLKRHFLKHHEVLQETYISGCCNKKFKTKEGLKQHIQKGVCGVQIFQILESSDEGSH